MENLFIIFPPFLLCGCYVRAVLSQYLFGSVHDNSESERCSRIYSSISPDRAYTEMLTNLKIVNKGHFNGLCNSSNQVAPLDACIHSVIPLFFQCIANCIMQSTRGHGDHNHFLSFERKRRGQMPSEGICSSSLTFIPNQPPFPQFVFIVNPSPCISVALLQSVNQFLLFSCLIVHVPWCMYTYIHQRKISLLDMYAFFNAFLHQRFVTNVLIYNQAFSVMCLCYIGGSMCFNFAFHMKHNQA